DPDDAVGLDAWREPARRRALPQADLACVPDEPRRLADACHHAVAGVDAGRARDALELDAVADVDAHRAHGDALVAVDAVAAVGTVGAAHQPAARLAAVPVVRDGDRRLVHERAQHAA